MVDRVYGYYGITPINAGFDFLGFNVRKYGGKLLIEPSKPAVKRFLDDLRGLIKANKATKTAELIQQLNRKIRGWVNYYQHVVAKKTFTYVDRCVFRALMTWVDRRHPGKSASWKRQRYFPFRGLAPWSRLTCKCLVASRSNHSADASSGR